MQLDALPASTAAAVSELASYDWQSGEAREAYEQIKDLLGRELLDQRFAGMKQALEGATDEDRAAVTEMLRDLNELLEKHRLGEDTQEDFDDFMDKHGDFFPENPATSTSCSTPSPSGPRRPSGCSTRCRPSSATELLQLSAQAFGSPELMDQLGRMDDNLRALRPGEDWGGSEQFEGEQGLGLGDGTGALQDLADLDELADQLSQSYGGARLDDVDLDKLARQLGDQAAVDARTLQRLEQALRDSGYLRRGSDGDLRLSPKAMRQLGKSLLRDVAERMSGRQGQRDLRQAGAAGEPSGATREWAFGDTEPWDVTKHGHQRRAPRPRRRATAALGLRPPAGPRGAAAHRRRRGAGDRGPHAGLRGAAGGHVVLHGDGRALGADEAHRAGAAHAGLAAGSAATPCS